MFLLDQSTRMECSGKPSIPELADITCNGNSCEMSCPAGHKISKCKKRGNSECVCSNKNICGWSNLGKSCSCRKKSNKKSGKVKQKLFSNRCHEQRILGRFLILCLITIFKCIL